MKRTTANLIPPLQINSSSSKIVRKTFLSRVAKIEKNF